MKTTKSVIIAIAAITGASVQQECAAARAAFADMETELGRENVYAIDMDDFTDSDFDIF